MKLDLGVPMIVICGLMANAQHHDEQVIQHVVVSKKLGHNRDIQVFLPSNYAQETRSYPVLYILDGQQYFYNGVAYKKSLTHFDRTPEFMVVGIENYHPQRLVNLEAEAFLDFMEHELIPLIEEKYRTADDRLIFGWQSGGGLVSHLLLNRPHLFNAYFAASGVTNQLDCSPLDALLAKGTLKRQKYMYFTLGAGETWSTEEMQTFSEFLKGKAGVGLRWEYELLEEEDHWSTPYRTIYRGLQNYYADFRPIRFKSLADFEDKGGHEFLRKHYAARDKKYQLNDGIHRRTVFNLLTRCMQEDNYPGFTDIMKRYGRSQFQDWYKWDHWRRFLHRYGCFHLKHKQPDEALVVFEVQQEKFPSQASVYHDLADAFRAKGDVGKARKNYTRAVELAQKSGDPDLNQYMTDLQSLAR